MEQHGLVAVYGSLRKGLQNHRLLQDAVFKGTARVQGFKMFSLGAYPFITHEQATADDEITIEVYAVTPQEFNRLDQLEGYPSFYNRELIDTPYGQAWVYFIDKYSTDRYEQVYDGDWVQYRRTRYGNIG